MPTNLADIRRKIEETWGHSDPAFSYCANVISSLEKLADSEARMLSLNTIRRMALAPMIDESLIKAIAILCGSNVHVLRQNYVFIDEDGEHYEIERNEYENARSEGWLAHPHTGDKVYDFLDRVYPFYDLDLAALDEEQGGARG